MFESVDLFAGDAVSVLSSARAVFVQRPDSVRMRQPCAALEGSRCSVYEQRPAACRQFECKVLVGHRRGDLSLEQARSLIDRALTASRDLRPRLEALLPEPSGLSDLARLAGLATEPRPVQHVNRRSFPLLLADVRADLARRPDGDAVGEQHDQLLAAADELYQLLVESFGPGAPQRSVHAEGISATT